MEVKATRIWRPFWNVYIRYGFVMEPDNNAHEIKPAPYKKAILLSLDSVCDCEKYVTRPPVHWHWVTLCNYERMFHWKTLSKKKQQQNKQFRPT